MQHPAFHLKSCMYSSIYTKKAKKKITGLTSYKCFKSLSFLFIHESIFSKWRSSSSTGWRTRIGPLAVYPLSLTVGVLHISHLIEATKIVHCISTRRVLQLITAWYRIVIYCSYRIHIHHLHKHQTNYPWHKLHLQDEGNFLPYGVLLRKCFNAHMHVCMVWWRLTWFIHANSHTLEVVTDIYLQTASLFKIVSINTNTTCSVETTSEKCKGL